jgi:wyosine [tRNA(Phe)-imidazoG37] synthetase (radical SAM superfamily)
MLKNIPVDSCASTCWDAEKQGLPSRRIMMATDQPQQFPSHVQPKILNIVLGSTCNLTCVYCCKQYSSAWYRDIDINGSYFDENRFQITPIEQITQKLSQNEHSNSSGFTKLENEISKFDQLDQIEISGGEPFLYNRLSNLVNKFLPSSKIVIFTGLGVDSVRLQRELDKIKNLSNITIFVSAETRHALYEFVRYGNSFDKFLKNFEILKQSGCQLIIKSVLSNITISDIVDFQQQFNDCKIDYQFCTEPDFLNVNVLDNNTKQTIIEKIKNSNVTTKDQIIQAINQSYSEDQKRKFKHYLSEFASRRHLSLDIFPQSMIDWLELGENCVV